MQKAGGTFTLTADVDFGATYGLKSVYYKSRNTPSTAGIVRLGNDESVGWRNAANSANLELKVNASNLLEYNGSLIGILAAALTASRALVSDGSGNVSVSSVTSTQLAYLESATGTTGTTSTNLVFSTSPTFITPTLGAASATSINKVAITAPATGSTLTIADGKTVTLSKTMTVTSADDTSTLTLAAGAQTVGGSGAADITTNSGTQTLLNKTVVSSTSTTTGALNIPTGTVAQRPTAATGMIRHNSDTGEFEGYSNAAWQSIGGGVNERAIKNYYKAYAQSTIAPGTLSTVASTGNITVSGSGLSVTSAFYADVTSGASALTQDTSSAIRGTNSYLSALSSANTNGSVYFQFPAFVLDPVDLGKPVSVSFDLTSSIADGDYDVCMVRYTVSSTTGTYAEVIPVAGNASSSSVVPSAKLPTGTTSFQGFFVAGSTSTDVYALRIRRLVGSATIKLDSLYVGPQSVVQGAAVCEIPAPTVTFSNATGLSATTSSLKFFRVGKKMHIIGQISFTGTGSDAGAIGMSLTGYTWSTTEQIAGWVRGEQTTTSYAYNLLAFTASSSVLNFYTQNNGAASVTLKGTTMGNATSGDYYTFYCDIWLNITTWDDGVTMANRAVESFAADDGSSDVFGAAGALVPNSAFAINTVSRDFTFPEALQSTDSYVLEFSDGTGVPFVPASSYLPFITGNNSSSANFYGMRLTYSTTTTCRVTFGLQGDRVSASNVNNGNQAWSTLYSAGARFRVRKISGGASVGYPIEVSNLVDQTTGTTAKNMVATGTFTATATGMTTSPTCSMRYTRIGNMVVMSMDNDISGTSNATSFTLTGMPAALYPTTTQDGGAILLKDNGGAYAAGSWRITTGGVITLYTAGRGTFTGSGTKAILQTTFTYLIV